MIRHGILIAACVLSASCIASDSDWDAYIEQVANADHATIQTLPLKINSIGDNLNDEQAEQLTTALSMALIKDPLSVINATKSLDKSIDPLKQRFGTSVVCGIPLMLNSTKEQVEAYFVKAEPVLERAGQPAEECLTNMRLLLDEYRQGTK